MTNGDDGETSPRWSPDGSTIAFLSERGDSEETQLYLLPNQGGEALQLTSHPTAVSRIEWAPDGTAIYYLASDPKTEEEQARDEFKDDVYMFEEDFKQQHLWKFTVADETAARITEGDFSVMGYNLSPDGRQVALHRAPNPVLESADSSEVWLMTADGTEARRLTDNDVREGGAAVSPEGTQVLFLARTNDRFEKYYNGNMFVAGAAGSAAQLVAETQDYDVNQARWSGDGQSIVFLANLGVHSELFRLNLADRMVEQLTEGQHAIRAWTVEEQADRHVVTFSRSNSPGDVWLLSAPSDEPRRVTRVYDFLDAEFALPRQERVEWAGVDGVTVEGLLYYPVDYQEGRRYPLVVQTHGGPQASDKFGWVNPSSYVPGAHRPRLRRAEAELSGKYGLRRHVPTGHGRRLLQARPHRCDGRCGLPHRPRDRRWRPHGQDGVERWRPYDEQDHYLH